MKVLQLQCIVDAKDRELQILREKASQDPEVPAIVVLCELSCGPIVIIFIIPFRFDFAGAFGAVTARERGSAGAAAAVPGWCSARQGFEERRQRQQQEGSKQQQRRKRGQAAASECQWYRHACAAVCCDAGG